MQEKVAMSLHRLGNGDELWNKRDLYEIYKSTLLKKNSEGVL